MTEQALKTYQNRIKIYQAKILERERKSRLISNLRLLISLGGIGLSIYLYLLDRPLETAAVFIVTVSLFAFLVFRHQRIRKEKNFAEIMAKINEESAARFSDAWTEFPDTGKEFVEESHPYLVDLDIFGRRSLFQLINCTNTILGRQKLKELLLNPSLDKSDVLKRQGMIKELAAKLDFRQNLQGEGRKISKSNPDPEELFHWAKNQETKWTKPFIAVLTWLSPLVLIGMTILSVLLPKVIPFFIPLIHILCHALILFYFNKRTTKVFTLANKYQESIKSYQKMLKAFEEENFTNYGLKNFQKGLKKKHRPAFQQIERLKKAVDMTYLRYHQLYLIFNLFTLWDFHCLRALESWKKESGRELKNWLSALGEIEALASLAILLYDHPDWCFPQFLESHPQIKAQNLGHPLLPLTRVANDMEINKRGEILLITGSNMSGKSTFLRTVGINLVLAYMGAPVCAEDFQGGFFHIYTSMRINDNLDTGTSSFLAELLRIKTILEKARAGEPILFLLDEIFKGTNSRDRHTGARHLIKKLSKTGAIGLVSTHDLELGDLSKESPYIKNYHFAEYYQNGKILFDYKLKPGVSTTRNALFLMKMAGIEIYD